MKPIAHSTEAASLPKTSSPGQATGAVAQAPFDLLFALIAPVSEAAPADGETLDFLPLSGELGEKSSGGELEFDVEGASVDDAEDASFFAPVFDFMRQAVTSVPETVVPVVPQLDAGGELDAMSVAASVQMQGAAPEAGEVMLEQVEGASVAFRQASAAGIPLPQPARRGGETASEKRMTDQQEGAQLLPTGLAVDGLMTAASLAVPEPAPDAASAEDGLVAQAMLQSALPQMSDSVESAALPDLVAETAANAPAVPRQAADPLMAELANGVDKTNLQKPLPAQIAALAEAAKTAPQAPQAPQVPLAPRAAKAALAPANPLAADAPASLEVEPTDLPGASIKSVPAPEIRVGHPSIAPLGETVARAEPAVSDLTEVQMRAGATATSPEFIAPIQPQDPMPQADATVTGGAVQAVEAPVAPRAPSPAAPPPPSAPLPDTALNMRQNDWGRQLLDRIERVSRDGSEAFEISMRPKTLGALRISLEVHGERTSVHFVTETASAARMLLGSEDKLSQLLDQSGFRLGGFSAQGGGAGTQNGQPQPQKDRTTIRNGKRTEAVASEVAQTGSAAGATGSGVNMLA